MARPAPLWILLLFASLYSLQVLPGLGLNGLTYDEPMEVANGYCYWTKGDILSHHHHPPLSKALQALPLLGMDLEPPPDIPDPLDRAHVFFFGANAARLGTMTYLSRIPSWLFGLGIGILLFLCSRDRPRPLVLFTLFFWAFEPACLAFSGLAMADIPAAFFFLASVLAFRGLLKGGGPWMSTGTGALVGAAVTCKFSALVLLPLLLFLEFFGAEGKRGGAFRRWSWGLAGSILWVYVLYGRALPLGIGPLGPFLEFWRGLMDMAHYKGHPVYFLGQAARTSHLFYYPLAYLLKTPLSFLLMLGSGAVLWAIGKIRVPVWQWAPGVFFFAAIVPVQNLGVRYLLPAYPFLIMVAAQGALWIWERKMGLVRWVPVLFCGLQLISLGLSFPSYLGYFSEWVKPGERIYWLGDSNLDLGQDLKRVGKEGRKRGWVGVKLAYLGGVDPSAYGLSWEPWDLEDLRGPRPGRVYLVNASFLQLGPVFYPEVMPIARSWILDREPSGKIGDAWFYYEFPGKGSPGEKGPYLPSAPFLQHRGYAFPLAPSRQAAP